MDHESGAFACDRPAAVRAAQEACQYRAGQFAASCRSERAQEQGRILRRALEALTPHERQAIEIAYFAELTYSEAAAKLDQPVGTVKTRIRSGLVKLRQILAGTQKGR
jgi:RNA polymerase sigma factor (sigma-70 family)